MMTPMIDIVFQLLVFFIMTFRIIAPEGDFSIKMPQIAPGKPIAEETRLPLTVRLHGDSQGQLTGIALNRRPLESFRDLNLQVRAITGDDTSPGRHCDTEVELDCDHQLNFEHVVDAITALSGYVGADGRIVKVIEKIRFRPASEADPQSDAP